MTNQGQLMTCLKLLLVSFGDSIFHFFIDYFTTLTVLVLLLVAFKGYLVLQERRRREKWNSYGKDIVILHGVRALSCPSTCPFVIKLEMFLKMANIKYIFDSTKPLGSNGKTPWITLNNEDCCDTDIICNFLKNKLAIKIDLDSHLTEEQKGISVAFQIMTNEHFVWGLDLHRWSFDHGKQVLNCMNVAWYSKLTVPFLSWKISSRAKSQGIGLHSQEEIYSIMKRDLEAISFYLGSKKFMMGDKLSEVDCSIFGMMSQFMWIDTNSPFTKMIQNDYKNIVNYCYNVKDELWPNWFQYCETLTSSIT